MRLPSLLMSAAGGLVLGSLAASLSPSLVAQASLLARQEQPEGHETVRPVPMRTAPTQGLTPARLGEAQVHYYMKKPAGEGTWPAVVLLHDAMGLGRDFMSATDRLASEGFVVMALDLYGGKVALDADKGRELGVLMDEAAALAGIEAVAGYLRFLPEVGDHRVGLVGFDLGGRMALRGAMGSRDVSAIVVAYSRPLTDADSLRRIGCPILAIYGEEDRVIPQADVEAFRSALASAGRTALVRTFPGAGHGFMTAAVPAAPAGDAWALMVSFLKEHL